MTPRASGLFRCCIVLIAASALAAVAIPWVMGDAPDNELEHNRQLLATARLDPAHYSRLKRDLRVFLSLPGEEQDRLRQLDRDMRAQTSANSARLFRVMERYSTWFENLPTDDRQLIDSTTKPKERLEHVKQIREHQWVVRLPKTYRDKLERATGEERAALVKDYRQKERSRRQEWQVALRHWDEMLGGRVPSRLRDFPQPLQSWVNEQLKPRLNAAELDRLEKTEGQWPLFPQTLVELADKHAPLLPGPATGPKCFAELPKEVQEQLQRQKPGARAHLAQAEGKWPDYALRVARMAQQNNIDLARPLGPSRPEDFAPALRDFLGKTLEPALTADEKNRLKKAEGRWPAYPRAIVDLARKYQLAIPGMTLPGSREMWNKFRSDAAILSAAAPDLPDRVLFNFARNELSQEEKAGLRLFPFDREARDRLKEMYFKRHPDELERLRRSDRRKDRLAPAGAGAASDRSVE